MKYLLVCNTSKSANIHLTSSGSVKCINSQIQVVSYSPNLGQLNNSQVLELFGATIFLFALAFVFKVLRQFLFNR